MKENCKWKTNDISQGDSTHNYLGQWEYSPLKPEPGIKKWICMRTQDPLSSSLRKTACQYILSFENSTT